MKFDNCCLKLFAVFCLQSKLKKYFSDPIFRNFSFVFSKHEENHRNSETSCDAAEDDINIMLNIIAKVITPP